MKTKTNERTRHICAFIEKELGKSELNRLLLRVGSSPSDYRDTEMSAMQEATLLREACRASGDISLAARIGASFKQASTLTAYIVRSSATLRTAIQNGARTYGLGDGSTNFVLRQQDQTDILEVITPDGALTRHHRFQEFRVYGLLARLRAIAGVEFYPEALCFLHEATPDAKMYERIAGCRVLFGSGFNGIRFAEGALDRALPGHDAELVEYLTELAREHARKVHSQSHSARARVEALIIESLPNKMLTADEVSTQLGMSRRTLARHLKQEKTTFREVLETIRFDLAQTYLRDGLTITDTAYLLGYAEHAAFSTAFRRWAGESPRAFQQKSTKHP